MDYSNPFDDPQGRFFILVNDVMQYSLWPAHCALPPGWRTVTGPQDQEACRRWLEAHWQTIQPAHFVSDRLQ
ncbi:MULTISPECIES: MbtH family protein [Tenebrionibacter/Tenebrionicola group]|jgi:uncharacterized protein YbdZ (MbtH family)|uniref:MbtH family NRPS accessory protein n=2 Tax=Tenebrionibacter/Tenebrionicola group TaxID=2969848 RepID=A0A8K0XWW4_9ENTR|nr:MULTISPECIES: MbtH family NRPS accessory protein [Tenebrionibacter/Tenebrionicola group]MBK4714707.1 MbtH family NRPS accessory protein [Tenebrionibacter intestinalis]MBV4413861.1 MbtH family NRPS accessory protein [Tenebrionicola larvae]MBV5095177.1 MbtH family NRPS accessory protein [Tenebrionicola larvae]